MSKYNYRINLSSSQFREFRERDLLYVDKSLFIEHILDDASDVLMFTRPRRMGKTLNLTMLKTFIDTKETDVAPLFEGLKLENSDVYDQMGTHPVIFFSFRDFQLEGKEDKFRDIIGDVISRYLTQDDVSQYLKKFLDGDNMALSSSVRQLCKDIDNALGVKPFIIIDEYDKLYMDSAKLGEEAFNDARDFTKGIMSACLKDNPHLFKAVITGVNRIAQESMFSDLNNIKVYGVFTESRYDEDFGFTEEEVAALVTDDNDLKDVRDWYNNYRVGGSKIYFTYSVMSYLECGKLNTYWTNSGTINLIKNGINSKRLEQITSAINGEKFIAPASEKIIGEDLNGLRKDSAFYSLLVQTGYLTFDETDILNEYELSIPNVEIKNAWNEYLLEDVYQTYTSTLIDVFKNPEELDLALRELMNNKLSYFDFTIDDPEMVYHAFVAGMLAIAGVKYKSNRESGRGRFDISASANGVNYIFEFKKGDDADNLKNESAIAIQQIKDKNYIADVDQSLPTYLIGIGFHLKECEIVVEECTPVILRLSSVASNARPSS
jgi:hypothetical protein